MKSIPTLLLILALLASTARADVADVSQRIRRSPSLSKTFGNWIVKDSLIDGYFAISARPNDRPCVIEGNLASVICDKDWLRLNPTGGGSVLDLAAAREKNGALFQAVRLDEAILLRFGTGSHKAILVSAYDCPKCRALERNLDQIGKQLDVTIHIFPMALDTRSTTAMQTATDLWCRADAEPAWHAVMLGKSKPSATGGGNAGRCGMKVAQNSAALAAAFGAKTVPTLILESGEVVRDAASLPPPSLVRLLGK